MDYSHCDEKKAQEIKEREFTAGLIGKSVCRKRRHRLEK